MDEASHRPDNPYTELEGYAVLDVRGEEIGEVQETVYDAPSDVLKYIIVGGRAVLAERIETDPEGQRVFVPYGKETVESAPEIEEPSGQFDEAVREHYGEG